MGYLYGRFALPRMLKFPFRAQMVGRSFFLAITLFLILRGFWTYFFAHHFFDSWLTLSAYVDVAIISLGITYGYNSFTLGSPDSLKSAIAAMKADGILLANPFEDSKR